MVKELSSIIAQAAQVRDAQLSAENTAERVGGVLCNLLEYVCDLMYASGVSLKADSNGTGFTFTFYDKNGTPSTQTFLLPSVSASMKGLMTPELLTKLNNTYTQSGTNAAAIETRRLEIEELTKRLKGTSDYSNAFTDPQVFLGDLDTIEEVNAAIDALVTSAASPETKYTGYCVVGLLGSRFDIHQYALHFATGDFVQCVSGCVNISADAMSLQQHGQYNIVFRRVSNFTPDIWKGISTLIPNADEMYYGLLDPRDKMKLNNVVDLGNVTTSATAENWAKKPSYLTEKKRPTIFQYYDARNAQVGMIISLPASATTFGQTLLLGTYIYRRTVTVNGTTSTATSWTSL